MIFVQRHACSECRSTANRSASPSPRVEDAGGVVHATVGRTDVAVFATGEELTAYEARDITFEPADEPDWFHGDGTRWGVATGESTDGRALTRLPAHWTFAFSWQSDHGASRFYEIDTERNPDASGRRWLVDSGRW